MNKLNSPYLINVKIPSVLCLSGTLVIKDLEALFLNLLSEAGKITEHVTTFINPLDYRYQCPVFINFESSGNIRVDKFKRTAISQSSFIDKIKPKRNLFSDNM